MVICPSHAMMVPTYTVMWPGFPRCERGGGDGDGDGDGDGGGVACPTSCCNSIFAVIARSAVQCPKRHQTSYFLCVRGQSRHNHVWRPEGRGGALGQTLRARAILHGDCGQRRHNHGPCVASFAG